jgi:CxxC motif-containing protein (DUF1111 family)
MTTFSLKWQRKPLFYVCAFAIAAVLGIMLSNFLNESRAPSPQEMMRAGGDITVFNQSSKAYGQPAEGLNSSELDRHRDGDVAFGSVFVTPPATVNAGLGPFFNNSSCTACHIRDGRGLPEKGQLLVRVSDPKSKYLPLNADSTEYHLEGGVESENTPPVVGLGNQIQDQSVYGKSKEAEVEIAWMEKEGNYGDGTTYSLRSPIAKITLPDGKLLSPDIQTSLRLPPPIFGLGLLEAVPEKTLLKSADPDDKNGDGISGRVNEVWDVSNKKTTVGRFGWKANNPNLLQQSAGAYVNDMGVTSPLFPKKDTPTDIDRHTLDLTTFYVQTLGVPARRNIEDVRVKKGEKLFNEANCGTCHFPSLQTGEHKVKLLAGQKIHPYTDLLLHDMGEGLADRRPDFLANGTEWRTTPLWGIGLTQTVLPYASYLHDGRARTLEESILWHGGESEASKEAFRNMSSGDREALLGFLRSL